MGESDSRLVLGLVETRLGVPSHKGEGYLIYQGDCMELMQRLGDPVFDLTITSPPYNIGKEYEQVKRMEDYLQWCSQWIEQIYRLTATNGAFWLNLGYVSLADKAKAIPIPYLLWDRIPFYLIQEIIWNYGAGVACRLSFSPRNEKFLWYVKNPEAYTFNLDAVRDPNVKYPNQKKNGRLKCNQLGKNPTDVWQFPKVTSGEKRSSRERMPHPAQFPIAVIERIIKACSNPKEIVFDPFVGSGTVIEAALRNGRLAVGFEINKGYADLAAKRIAGFLLRQQDSVQHTLF